MSGPLEMGPQSPDPGRPSYTSTKPSAPKGGWMLWAARTLKRHLVSTSSAAGVPTSSLLPSCPTNYSTLGTLPQCSTLARVATCLGVKGNRQEGRRHQPFGAGSGTCPSKLEPRNTTSLSLRLWLPEGPAMGTKKPAALWTIPVTTTWKPVLLGTRIHKACRAFKQ